MEEVLVESPNLRVLFDTDTQEVVIEHGRMRLSNAQNGDILPDGPLEIENRVRVSGELICRLAKRICEGTETA